LYFFLIEISQNRKSNTNSQYQKKSQQPQYQQQLNQRNITNLSLKSQSKNISSQEISTSAGEAGLFISSLSTK